MGSIVIIAWCVGGSLEIETSSLCCTFGNLEDRVVNHLDAIHEDRKDHKPDSPVLKLETIPVIRYSNCNEC